MEIKGSENEEEDDQVYNQNGQHVEGPCKGHTTLETHEQGRIAERCQTAAHVGNEKDEEYHEMHFVLRHALARIRGRMSNIAAPVVPIQLARNVPMNKRSTFIFGVPAKVPLMAIPPAATNKPKSKTMKGI